MQFITGSNVTLPKMRLLVVFVLIAELQRFWVFADPKPSPKEPMKVSQEQPVRGTYKMQSDPSWIAAESRRHQTGFLSARDYSLRHQPRMAPLTDGRYRPQEYYEFKSSPRSLDYMPRIQHTWSQKGPAGCQRYTQTGTRPLEYKDIVKGYRQFSMIRPETKYTSPQVDSEGYHVVNEDPHLHTAVVSASHQYSQPEVIQVPDNGPAFAPQVSEYSQPRVSLAYERPEPIRKSADEGYLAYSPPKQQQQQQPEMHSKPHHLHHSSMQKSMSYVTRNTDGAPRIEMTSNQRIMT